MNHAHKSLASAVLLAATLFVCPTVRAQTTDSTPAAAGSARQDSLLAHFRQVASTHLQSRGLALDAAQRGELDEILVAGVAALTATGATGPRLVAAEINLKLMLDVEFGGRPLLLKRRGSRASIDVDDLQTFGATLCFWPWCKKKN
jgi:hypothetical protein